MLRNWNIEFWNKADKSDKTKFWFKSDVISLPADSVPIVDDNFERSIPIQYHIWDVQEITLLCNQDTLPNLSRIKGAAFAKIYLLENDSQNQIIDTSKPIDFVATKVNNSSYYNVVITYFCYKITHTPILDFVVNPAGIFINNSYALKGMPFSETVFGLSYESNINAAEYGTALAETGDFINKGSRKVELQYSYPQKRMILYLSEADAKELVTYLPLCDDVKYKDIGDVAYTKTIEPKFFDEISSVKIPETTGIMQVTIIFKTDIIENTPL